MAKDRVKGGQKNENSGKVWSENELEKVLLLYLRLVGKGIHETNPEIIALAHKLNRTVRSLEAQLIMFRSIERDDNYGHKNSNKICKKLWDSRMLLEPQPEYTQKEKQIKMDELSGLYSWYGHSKGGVKIAFTDKGTPTSITIKTDLIHALDEWGNLIINSSKSDLPFSKIFFLGGPGNGKTEALDYVVKKFITDLNLDINVLDELRKQAYSAGRSISLDLKGKSNFKKIVLIQDASKGEDLKNSDPSEAMIDDIDLLKDKEVIYICCINRGILLDVLELAKRKELKSQFEFFKAISDSIEASSGEVRNSWPIYCQLEDALIPIGVWPMEVSSLFKEVSINTNLRESSPFEQALKIALDHTGWDTVINYYKEFNINIELCPLLINKRALSTLGGKQIANLINDFEISTNRRTTFREMLSFIVYILIGRDDEFVDENGNREEPHNYIARLIKRLTENTDNEVGYQTLFSLSMCQWEFRLFNSWPDISEICADKYWKNFLVKCKSSGIYQATSAFCNIFSSNEDILATDLDKILMGLSKQLDPSKLFIIRDYAEGFNPGLIDLDLQDSVEKCINGYSDSLLLSVLDKEMLNFFSLVEKELDDIRLKNDSNSVNAVIERLNYILRKVTSTYIKRKLGASSGVSGDIDLLNEYISYDNDFELKEVIQELLDIRNTHTFTNFQAGEILIDLNTTFGQPALELSDIYLKKSIQFYIDIYAPNSDTVRQPLTKSKYLKLSLVNSPASSKNFIIPFSFHLFKAIRDMGNGLKKGTLPRDIVATFDRMKSFLEGVAAHTKGDASIVFPNGDKLNTNSYIN